MHNRVISKVNDASTDKMDLCMARLFGDQSFRISSSVSFPDRIQCMSEVGGMSRDCGHIVLSFVPISQKSLY